MLLSPCFNLVCFIGLHTNVALVSFHLSSEWLPIQREWYGSGWCDVVGSTNLYSELKRLLWRLTWLCGRCIRIGRARVNVSRLSRFVLFVTCFFFLHSVQFHFGCCFSLPIPKQDDWNDFWEIRESVLSNEWIRSGFYFYNHLGGPFGLPFLRELHGHNSLSMR